MTTLIERFRDVRGFTAQLCEPLLPEDCVIQSMPDVSPTRWHLAHTTWFFETFVTLPYGRDNTPFDDAYSFLFNSYYNAIGKQFPRERRGLLSRPSVEQVWDYRRHVDRQLIDLLKQQPGAQVEGLIELGLQHEQQHQELMLTDIKHVLSCNPVFPVYRDDLQLDASSTSSLHDKTRWCAVDRHIGYVGHGGEGFAYDNETPRHEQLIPAFEIADRLVTNRQYLHFVEDRGYHRPDLWLSLGWNHVQAGQWRSPLYWVHQNDRWYQFTLGGLQPLNLDEPVCHVSYFEADAFARWCDARLPTEFEWEVAVAETPVAGNFADTGRPHPRPLDCNQVERGQRAMQHSGGGAPLYQCWGDVWEWTSSPYIAYPGYQPDSGALGEYNGKFMCNQYVLRGGSCATSSDHIRASYRNFFPPDARWQFSGIRLAGV